MWNSFAGSDNFVFKFASGAHAAMADFHPLSDILPFGNSLFAQSVQAALNAPHDDFANTAMDLSGHDTSSELHKVLLHVSDFHVV